MRHIKLLALLLGLFALTAHGQNARLTGVITDAENKEPLTGVNLVVKGSYKGAATDIDGRYLITGLPSGTLDLEISYLGFKTVLATALPVLDGQTTTRDFALERAYLAGEDVVIIGERPLLEVDNTSSSTRLKADEISTKVVEDVSDVVAQQVGVVKDDNEIHIRGGRVEENLYIIDGLSVKDPISGQGYGVYLSADAVQEIEIITGGFNAEYGEAMSGVINVETREGTRDFFVNTSWKRDNLWQDFPAHNQNQDVFELSLGGPLPTFGLPGDLSFFVNGYGSFGDSHLPHATKLQPWRSWMESLALREENDASALLKISYRPKLTRKFVLSLGRSLKVNQGYFDSLVEDRRFYPYAYQQNLDNYNTFTQQSSQFSLTWKETLNRNSFFELVLGDFFVNQHADVNGKHWTEYSRPLDIDPTWYLLNRDGTVTLLQGDGFWDYGDTDYWHDHFGDTWSLKGSLTSKLNDEHELKSGFEVENTELQLLHINAPWLGTSTSLGRDYDQYHVWTTAGAVYLQDKISFKGMNANIGMRMDVWRPGGYIEDVVNDPSVVVVTEAGRRLFEEETFGAFGGRWKAQLSPRLGISHPVTDNDVLFFSYGHFSQRPRYAYVYANLRSNSANTYQLIGNPNLNPTTTVAYELGLKHRFNEFSALELTAFYKDMFNYVTAFSVNSLHPRYGNINYTQYYNIDYARSRGLEMSWRQRFQRYWSFNWNFSYSILTGKSSSPAEDLLNQARISNADTDLGENFLRWDKPITTSANINFYLPSSQPLAIGGFRLPVEWGANLHLEYDSGNRYSPEYIDIGDPDNPLDDEPKRVDTDPYTELAQAPFLADLNLYKNFQIKEGGMRTIRIKCFCEIRNLFNNKQPASSGWINPLTGKVWEDGDPFVASNRVYYEWDPDLSLDGVRPPGTPARFKAPRQVMFGLSIGL
ncbi:MAG: TonB-dependent receptor [Calditrichaeota bacterium]|nr:TonB-dependent receptor [Calditrichota bacterium]